MALLALLAQSCHRAGTDVVPVSTCRHKQARGSVHATNTLAPNKHKLVYLPLSLYSKKKMDIHVSFFLQKKQNKTKTGALQNPEVTVVILSLH